MSDTTFKLVSDRIAEVQSMRVEGYSDDAIRDVCHYYQRLISRSLKDDYNIYVHVTSVIRDMETADAVGDIQKVHNLAAKLQGKGKRASFNLSTRIPTSVCRGPIGCLASIL